MHGVHCKKCTARRFLFRKMCFVICMLFILYIPLWWKPMQIHRGRSNLQEVVNKQCSVIKPNHLIPKIKCAAKFNTDWIYFFRFATRQWRCRNISLSSSARLWQRIRNCSEQSGTRIHCQSIGARPHLLAPCRMRQLGRTEWSQSQYNIYCIFLFHKPCLRRLYK